MEEVAKGAGAGFAGWGGEVQDSWSVVSRDAAVDGGSGGKGSGKGVFGIADYYRVPFFHVDRVQRREVNAVGRLDKSRRDSDLLLLVSDE